MDKVMYWIYERGSTRPLLKKTVRIFDDLIKAGKYYLELSGEIKSYSAYIYIVDNEEGIPKKLNNKEIMKLFMENELLKKEVTKCKLRNGR
jgi:hypothetical protein